MPNVATFLRCPYCGIPGAHARRVSKATGTIRVKILPNNVWICECARCSKVFRAQMVGKLLTWYDMSPAERATEKKKAWVVYEKAEKVARIIVPGEKI